MRVDESQRTTDLPGVNEIYNERDLFFLFHSFAIRARDDNPTAHAEELNNWRRVCSALGKR